MSHPSAHASRVAFDPQGGRCITLSSAEVKEAGPGILATHAIAADR
jgi:hypothetical protein